MNKLYVLVAAVVFLCGGVGYGVWTMRQAVAPETTGVVPVVTSTPPTNDEVASDHVTGNDSLQSILTLGKTLECSFKTDDEKMPTEGSAFFDNGKLRVDTMYTGASSSVDTSSLIIANDTMYTWAKTKVGSFAMKLPLSAVPKNPTTHRDGQVSLQNKVQYNCKPWHVDGSVFVPPTTITFMYAGAMMKGIPVGSTSVPQQ